MPRFLLLPLTALLALSARAQAPTPPPQGDVLMDAKGVLRWQKTKREVALLGVNYTAPFAYAYRALAQRGIRHEDAIDQDVYHLSRLGVDAFRVHVWDIEITDSLGNLQPNEHLRLLDYLITKLKARGIKIILTPIAYWGNAYPEPTNTGRGFSSLYDKEAAYTNPRAIRAQENYLGQFLNHRNQYSGERYREDPDIIAYEVCNEPKYHLPLPPVLRFANRMVAAMRATGLRKPIFYNIAESPLVHDAILDANVQGISFQWYPENLVSGHELRGNFLPYVDQYPLPYKGDPRFERKAKLVYEFESADVLQPVMYPFMAKSLREAGFQWATQFAYDPLGLAYANTEYQTHYLNLAYTPAKALSLLIAGKVFRETRRGQSFGRYPTDSVFGPALVSYRRQLSQWNTPAEFYYTTNTNDKPLKLAALRHVAGVGSSAVVQYGGSGAYFLDQLAPGTWRLEVMPDAVPVSDPFATASLSKVVTRIAWNEQPLTIALSDLGTDFQLKGLNDGNAAQARASGGQLLVRPGAYLLTKAGQDDRAWTARTLVGPRQLGEFVAPPATAGLPLVQHLPVAQATAGQPLAIVATVAGASPLDSVLLVAQHYYGPTRSLPMQPAGATQWAASVPATLTYPGLLRYWVVLKRAGQSALTFPGRQVGTPRDWDFAPAAAPWQVPLVAATAPLPLFTAATDRDAVEAKGIADGAYIDYPTAADGALALRFVVPLAKAGALAPAVGPAAALRAYLGTKTAGRAGDLSNFKELVIKAQGNQPAATQLRVVLVSRDAVAYEATVALPAAGGVGRVPLSALRPAPLLLTPRPYPGFLPLTSSPASSPAFRLGAVEVLQVILDQPSGLREPLWVEVESVTLE